MSRRYELLGFLVGVCLITVKKLTKEIRRKGAFISFRDEFPDFLKINLIGIDLPSAARFPEKFQGFFP